jgi:hypothetical protein
MSFDFQTQSRVFLCIHKVSLNISGLEHDTLDPNNSV